MHEDGWHVAYRDRHFCKRLWQRYRIILEIGEIDTIRNLIHTGGTQKVNWIDRENAEMHATTLPTRNVTIYIVAERRNKDQSGIHLVTVYNPQYFVTTPLGVVVYKNSQGFYRASDYDVLKAEGHTPAKAAQIALDARRGDKYAVMWIDAARKAHDARTGVSLIGS